MANLNFKYGTSWESLNKQAISNGTIYITKEEKAMYVDLDDTRYRLGQIIDKQTWADFNKDVTTPPQNPEAYYYIVDQNALLRYDTVNSKWNQINSTATIANDLSALQDRVSGAEIKITRLENKAGELEKADKTNSDAIAAETTRAKSAEADLQTAIDNEAATARAAEQANANSIAGLTTRMKTVEDTYAKTATVNEQVAGLQEQITGNDDDIAALQDELNSATGIKARLTDVEAKATTNANGISGLNTKVSNIESSYVKTTTFDEKVSDLEGDIATNASGIADLNSALDTAGTGIKARLTAVEDKATSNANDIAGLKTLTDGHTTDIANLKAADTANSDAIAAEKSRAEKAEDDLQSAIDAEAATARAAEQKNAGDIAANKTLINNNTTKINNNATEISNLKKLVGTIPEDSSADNVVDFVIEQMEAADAMTYQGGISKWADLPTTGVEAGFTYVVMSDFVQEGESYYAGDLVIANADQTGASYAGGWTHVKTGYVASQENKLVQSGNGVKLTAYTGTDLGSFEVESDNLTISTAAASNKTTLKIDLNWGTF